jgi:hypothetical protein
MSYFILFLKKDGCLGCHYFPTATRSSRHLFGHVRLQRRDDQFYSPTRRVLVRNHQLANLDRAQACPALENIFHLRKKLVILEPQVAIG